MKIEIKHRWNGSVLFSLECSSIKEAVQAAVKQKVNLRGSNLSGSNLRGSNLRGSDLSGSNLRDSNLTPIRDDYWAVLSAMPTEVQGLRDAIAEGRINGSQYDGDCSCLVGTLAKVKGCHYQNCGILKPDSSRPSERLFLNIKPGDTPDTNKTAKIVLEWTDQWLANMRAAFAPKTTQ